MLSVQAYLILANEADMRAETSANPEMRAHFLLMATEWRRLASFAEATEACRPAGPV